MNHSSLPLRRGNRQRHRLLPLTLVSALALALAACSSSAPTSSGPPSSSNSSSPASSGAAVSSYARSLLPASIKSSGTLALVSDFLYPPYAMKTSSGQFEGSDYDIGSLLATVLGLKPQWTQSIGFDTLIPAVQSGRFQVAMEGIDILPARLQVVSFIRYLKSQDTVLVLKGNPSHVNPADLCGTTVANQAGDAETTITQEISKQCVANGKPAIKQESFPTVTAAILAVQAHHVEGFVDGVPSCVYTAKQTPAIGCASGVLPPKLDLFFSGIAVAKSETQLGKALTAALAVAQKDGRYAAILKRWGLSELNTPAKFYPST